LTQEETNRALEIYRTMTQSEQVHRVVKERESRGVYIHPISSIWRAVKAEFGGGDWRTKTPEATIHRIVGQSDRLFYVAENTAGSGKARKLARK